jgi:type II secretory pathway pseudopilin PulG
MTGKFLLQYIKQLKHILHSECGIALTEALVTMGITGIVAVAFLSSMSNTSQAVMTSQERVTAENLAKSQMEYIKSQPYSDENPPSYYELSPTDIPENFDIAISGEQLDGYNDTFQKIVVTIYYNSAEAFRLENCRAKISVRDTE